jgi:hypothetical protein
MKNLCLLAALFTSIMLAGAVQNLPGKPQTFLALGDSYTIGEGVDEHSRWPNQLVAELNKD